MSDDDKVSWVRNEDGEIIGKDTTEYREDGSSKTTHQVAWYDDLTGAHASDITGVTENSSDGTSENEERSSSSCFLTTACVSHRGLLDDCDELTVLRSFRREYVASLPNGPQLLAEYRRIAPPIVRAIEAAPDRDHVLSDVYQTVESAVALIASGRDAAALDVYEDLVLDLKARYRIL